MSVRVMNIGDQTGAAAPYPQHGWLLVCVSLLFCCRCSTFPDLATSDGLSWKSDDPSSPGGQAHGRRK
jgi:hypothetical protein